MAIPMRALADRQEGPSSASSSTQDDSCFRGPGGALPIVSVRRETLREPAAAGAPSSVRGLPPAPPVLASRLLAIAHRIRERKPDGCVALAVDTDPAFEAALIEAAQLITTGSFRFDPRRAIRRCKQHGSGFRVIKTSISPVDRVVDRWLSVELAHRLPDARGLVRQVQEWGREATVTCGASTSATSSTPSTKRSFSNNSAI